MRTTFGHTAMRRFAAALLAAVSCVACVSKQHAEMLTAQNDSIRSAVQGREQVYGELFGALDRLTAALASAEMLEKELRETAAAGSISAGTEVETLRSRMQRLSGLMVVCRTELQVIRRGVGRLEGGELDLIHLEALTARLGRRISRHQNSVLALRSQVYSIEPNARPHTTGSQTSPADSTARSILAGNDMLHTAYYIVALRKELLGEGIARRSHLFWGPLKVNEDCPLDRFEKVDSRDTRFVPIGRRNALLISVHPEDSYGLIQRDGLCDRLEIYDPEDFWSQSKVLVISYDK